MLLFQLAMQEWHWSEFLGTSLEMRKIIMVSVIHLSFFSQNHFSEVFLYKTCGEFFLDYSELGKLQWLL